MANGQVISSHAEDEPAGGDELGDERPTNVESGELAPGDEHGDEW